MISPVVLAGGAALVGLGFSVLSKAKRKPVFAVVRIHGRGVSGKFFDNMESAVSYQDKLAREGYGSVLLQKKDGTYSIYRSISARTRAVSGFPMGKVVSPSFSEINLSGIGVDLSGRGDDFDTNEEMLKITQKPGDIALPPEAIRARLGPYPKTYIKREGKPVQVPTFRDTVSSHEWRTVVHTRRMKPEFSPPIFYGNGHKNLVQVNPYATRANV